MTTSEVFETPLLLSVDRAAAMLGIGRTRVYELIADGELPSVRIGRSRRVAAADVVAFVDRLRNETRIE